MNWTIIPGRIVTSADAVKVVAQHSDVVIFEISLQSKYPGTPSYALWGSERHRKMSVILHSCERSLYLNEDARNDTQFVVSGLSGEWTMFAEATRYTAIVVAYKR